MPKVDASVNILTAAVQVVSDIINGCFLSNGNKLRGYLRNTGLNRNFTAAVYATVSIHSIIGLLIYHFRKTDMTIKNSNNYRKTSS